MYWYAKLIIGIIVLMIVGGLVYAFRDTFDGISLGKSEEPPAEVVDGGENVPDGAAGEEGPTQPQLNEREQALLQKLKLATDLLQKEELVNSRKLAENVLIDPNVERFGEVWWKAAELVGRVNSIFLFTDAPCPEKKEHVVQRGDSLAKIAKAFGTSVALVQKSNNMDETNTNIFPDQVFRVYHGQWQINVSKSQFLLMLMDGERLVKVYKVGLGRQNRTPLGTFVIDLKDFEPDWWQPGRVVKFGDPENVLGTRWMGLKPTGGTNTNLKGYGIHGTWEPDSIGKAASQGCVRMLNADVEELFDIVPERISVTIVE